MKIYMRFLVLNQRFSLGIQQQNQMFGRKVVKVILLLCLVCLTYEAQRNLQFTHFVPEYQNPRPNSQTYGVFPFLNPFDPYLPISFSTGVGNNVDGPQFIVKCESPLQFINGACRCPEKGRLIGGRCFSKKKTENQPTNTINDPITEIKEDIEPEKLSGLSLIWRSLDGTGNNIVNPQNGAKQVVLERRAKANYKDGYSEPVDNLPNPRRVSNAVGNVEGSVEKSKSGITMAFTIFGQFLDHDLDLTESGQDEPMNIKIPDNDNFFTERNFLPFRRSKFINGTTSRDHVNFITAWIDGSQIYGSDEITNRQLREFSNGKMRVSEGNLLPKRSGLFIAGDIRINENAILTSYHTIFVREHNRICDRLIEQNPALSDDEVFRAARNYVIGLLQKITFFEFLPLLLGEQAYDEIIGEYQGYNDMINPNIETEFSAAAFRIGHSLLVNKYKVVNKFGQIYHEHRLTQLFFKPQIVTNDFIDDILRGLQITLMKQKSIKVADQLRNLLISDPDQNTIRLDLFAINLQRGRDHGIPLFNEARKAYGLPPLSTFEEILPSGETEIVQNLKRLYGSPDNLDLWVGIIAEKSLTGGVVGELGARIIGQTFRKLRDGDRHWFERFPQQIVLEIKQTSFSDIIKRNSNAKQITHNIFKNM